MPDLQKKKKKKKKMSHVHLKITPHWTFEPECLQIYTHSHTMLVVSTFSTPMSSVFFMVVVVVCCIFLSYGGLRWEGMSLHQVNYQEWNHCNKPATSLFHTDAFLSVSCDVNSSLNLSFLGVEINTDCCVYGDGLINLSIFYHWTVKLRPWYQLFLMEY